MEVHQSPTSPYEGPAYWNDSFVEFANTLGGLQFTTAECSMLADVIKSARRISSASSDRHSAGSSPRDRQISEPDWSTLITQPVRSEQNRIAKQQRRAIDRTKWNRSKAKTKSATAEHNISEAWIRHQEPQSVWSERAVSVKTPEAQSPTEDGCLAPALLHRESLDETEEPQVPDFPLLDFEDDTWLQTFISVPWS
ncbi:hypothetical protein DOTSEDRAFT_71502 [Dothistroma septosporum NZE10]|uniref:Uncharacterized protein n=1 Tax=Dothistroma septosporum (strain NZE10 / CBS 128990) TaxID=675120 RepID=N1PTT7_DOTSN|nr:hypothetical protein DOTSEDRAFT_71502 [Dothistroma septosporum NZE10]